MKCCIDPIGKGTNSSQQVMESCECEIVLLGGCSWGTVLDCNLSITLIGKGHKSNMLSRRISMRMRVKSCLDISRHSVSEAPQAASSQDTSFSTLSSTQDQDVCSCSKKPSLAISPKDLISQHNQQKHLQERFKLLYLFNCIDKKILALKLQGRRVLQCKLSLPVCQRSMTSWHLSKTK